MTHTFETAASGRSKCRGCGRSIAKGDVRFGERLDNPFAEGTEMTHWYHPLCGAMRRPESMLETVAVENALLPDEVRSQLQGIAVHGAEHRRLERISGVQRSPSGRAACRSCKESIAKDEWRIKLLFFEAGMFNPSGFVHVRCSTEYFGSDDTGDILARISAFSTDLTEQELGEVADALDRD